MPLYAPVTLVFISHQAFTLELSCCASSALIVRQANASWLSDWSVLMAEHIWGHLCVHYKPAHIESAFVQSHWLAGEHLLAHSGGCSIGLGGKYDWSWVITVPLLLPAWLLRSGRPHRRHLLTRPPPSLASAWPLPRPLFLTFCLPFLRVFKGILSLFIINGQQTLLINMN